MSTGASPACSVKPASDGTPAAPSWVAPGLRFHPRKYVESEYRSGWKPGWPLARDRWTMPVGVGPVFRRWVLCSRFGGRTIATSQLARTNVSKDLATGLASRGIARAAVRGNGRKNRLTSRVMALPQMTVEKTRPLDDAGLAAVHAAVRATKSIDPARVFRAGAQP